MMIKRNHFRKSFFLFYLILGGMVLGHLFYIYYFYSVGSLFMATFNIFSVTFYVILFAVFYLKNTLQVLNLLIFEVCIHAFFAAITIGMNNGFEVFLICTVFASLHLARITKSSKMTAYFMIGFSFMLLLAMRFLPYMVDMSFFQVFAPQSSLDFIYVFNLTIAFLMVVFIMLIYLANIKTGEEKLKLLNHRLSVLASHDSLTQLFNRRAMKQRLEAAINIQSKSNIGFVTAIADVDDFKKINDRYGHDCGDKVLKKVVQAIKENVRETDCISRWGGDEILILFNSSPIEGALTSLERIHKEICNSDFIYNGETIDLTITIGVCSSEKYSTYQDVIIEADHRLYDGKHNGKNCIVY